MILSHAMLVGEAVIPFASLSKRTSGAPRRGWPERSSYLKMNSFASALSSSLHAGLALPDHDDVVADAQKRGEYAFAHTLAVAEQKHHGRQSPDDAHHSQDGAQGGCPPVRPSFAR